MEIKNKIKQQLTKYANKYTVLTNNKNHLGVNIGDMIKYHNVDTVFDIGANIGQSVWYFRDKGYYGEIVSFEPITKFYDEMQKKCGQLDIWKGEKCALGDKNEITKIHISDGHGGSSSILDYDTNMHINAPELAYIDNESIQVITTKEAIEKYYKGTNKLFLKIDVQGFEKNVIDGAFDYLSKVVGIKIEMSIVSNYVGETLLYDMIPYLYNKGFRLFALEDGWRNWQSLELYQVDGFFFRA